jgi:hypothetical protein
MKIGEVSNILSEYLGLPSSLIFDDKTQKLSAICVDELSRIVALPGSFKFSASFRPPEIGEYFLDLKALVDENRLLVYKAIQSSEKPSIIMQGDRRKSASIMKVGFSLDLCVENANIAYIGTMAVTLLTPYIDSQGYVAVLNYKHRIMIVHVDELSNTLNAGMASEFSTSVTDASLGITAEDRAQVEQLLQEIRKETLD